MAGVIAASQTSPYMAKLALTAAKPLVTSKVSDSRRASTLPATRAHEPRAHIEPVDQRPNSVRHTGCFRRGVAWKRSNTHPMGMSGTLMSSDAAWSNPGVCDKSFAANTAILQASISTGYGVADAIEVLSACVPQTHPFTARRVS